MKNLIWEYGLVMHFIHDTFLIAMGIIVLNTMKFNIDRVSTFLGLICGVVGFLDAIQVVLNLNIILDSDIMARIAIAIYIIVDILPIVAISFSFNHKREDKNVIIDVLYVVFGVSMLVSFLVIFISDFNFRNIRNRSLYMELYALQLIVFLLVIINSVLICKNIKNDYKRYNFRKICILLFISRIPFILHPIINNVYLEDIINQLITNIAMYYLYKYIISSNIKKPYIKLNETNEQLVNKTEKLKNSNKKLVEETDRIQLLKEMLSSKEEKLQSILDSSPNSIIVFGKNKEIFYENKTFKRIFRINNSSTILNTDMKYNIKNHESLMKNIDHVLKTLCDKNDFIYTTNGKIYRTILTPLMIKSNLEGVLCIFIDKTKVKEIENNMIQENERYETFLERIDDGIVVLQNCKKIYVNRACKEIFKDTLNDIDFCIEENKEKMYIVNGKETYVEMQFSHYCKNGSNKIIIVVRNVTNRKIAQIKLKENQESYERFIDILPDGICVLDKNLDIYYANKSLLDMTDLKNIEEIQNINVKNIINLSKKQQHEFNEKMRTVLEKNKYMLLIDYEVVTRHENKIQVEISALPFDIEGGRHIILIIKDLTNKKTSEIAEKELSEILKTDKVKTEFFANMSHELKTPLNVISSSNQLLDVFYKKGRVDDYNNNIKYHIDLVRQNSYRLQRLINNIIDLTKVESGFYKLKLEEYNIVMVIEDLFMRVSKYSDKKDIRLIFDTNLEEINMYIDKSQIERIILNLLSNCIKFTEKGGSIYLNIYYNLDKVTIRVKDTGVGIPKDKIELVFEEFGQVDKTLSRNTEGSGIGLSIVKNLVKLHCGDISVRSEENKGTEFIINLPVKKIYDENNDKDRSIYNIDEKIKIEFSDIYY